MSLEEIAQLVQRRVEEIAKSWWEGFEKWIEIGTATDLGARWVNP